MVWGGSLGLSPADDIIIKVERMLDLDPEGQMIASVLSKKRLSVPHIFLLIYLWALQQKSVRKPLFTT